MPKKTRVSFGDAADVIGSAVESDRQRSTSVELLVLVGAGADPDLVRCVREGLVPAFENGSVRVSDLALAQRREAVGYPDACVVIAGDSRAGTDAVLRLAMCGHEVVYVVQSVLDAGFGALDEQVANLIHVAAGADDKALTASLAEALAYCMDSKMIALASAFPLCRHEVAGRLAKVCAMQNAAVGAIDLLPGADFPVMLVSQAKLVLDIAAAYGKPLGVERGLDVAGVLLVALAYRDVARKVLELVPGLSWLVRGGVGYAGTIATGRLMELRLDPPVAELKKRAQEVVARSSRLRDGVARFSDALRAAKIADDGGSAPVGLVKMPKNSEV